MLPGGRTRVALLVIIGLLTLNLCVCGMFSYQGSGIQQVGPRPVSIRSGSIGGPSILGGGPSTGK